jgi:rhodanese-related sulfurtransferase
MSELSEISPQTAKERLDRDEAMLVDVRDETEHQAEHIPQAMLHPLPILNPHAIIAQADGKKIIFHCLSGKRASKACASFTQQTGLEAACLKGSIQGWKDAGLETTLATGAISLERQVMMVAGSVVLTGVLLSVFLNPEWIWLSGGVGAGLLFAGISGSCMLKKLLMALPYNKGAHA